MRTVFIGSNGIRAGWRLAMYLGMFVAMALAANLVLTKLVHPAIGQHTISPWIGLQVDLPLFAIALIAAAVMSRIEHRPMGDYGLPLREAFGKRFWIGVLVGLLFVSFVVGAILALHGGRLDAAFPLRPAVIRIGALYALTFLAVAFLEEFIFRGYALTTLAQGIGFWPAAVLLSVLFGAAHLIDKSESPVGIAQVIFFGLVFCYVRRVTGSLWFAVGYHVAWDWGETFIYGVPDSGQASAASLFQTTLAGPTWLTGGTAGPEASVFSMIALLALMPLVWFLASRRMTTGTLASTQR